MDTPNNEVWRQSPLAPDHVQVSNIGRVRISARLAPCKWNDGRTHSQMRPGKMMSPWIANNGYPTVSITTDGARKKYLVHRLVASAFCDGFDSVLSVNHINCIKTDNRAENLEWITLAKNTSYQWRDGLVNLRGDNHPRSKLTADQVRHIRKALAAGLKPPALARMLNVSTSIIYFIKQGKRWASVQ